MVRETLMSNATQLDYLTVDMTARLLGISPRNLYYKIKRGDVPAPSKVKNRRGGVYYGKKLERLIFKFI